MGRRDATSFEIGDPRDFAEEMLRQDPDVTLSQVQQAAHARGILLHPHHFYAAARQLNADRVKKPRPKPRRREPLWMPNLEMIAECVRRIERDRDRYRSALLRIREVVEEALDPPR